MKIVNPYFEVQKNNIFEIREKEFNELEENIKKIVEPVKDLGFSISEVGIRESKSSNYFQLSKTVKRKVILKFKKDDLEIDLSMDIPKLVDRNYVIINGRKKIPIFQLFDIPVVTRKDTIRIRTSVATMGIWEDKEHFFVKVNVLKRNVPLALLIYCYYGLDAVRERFNLNDFDENSEMVNDNPLYYKLLFDLKMISDGSDGYTQEDFINELGGWYTKNNVKGKGEEIIYALDLIPKVDFMSTKFFQKDSVIEELIYLIQNKVRYDDTDFTNKRIRCLEYLILSKVSRCIFEFCLANRTKKSKFKTNTTQILTDCNVSDIVQFDFAINPIQEITNLSRTSLIGPGGFNRENVPSYLRDIHPSMYGRMCPVDTPDRDNCGVLQSLIPNSPLDQNLKFKEEALENQIVSASVSMVPFLEHDDQTRLQMSSSQMRQIILLKEFDKPLIQSGCEGLYTDYTQFIKRARKNGKVIYIDDKILILIYDDKDADVFDISYRKIYTENFDCMKLYVKVGDKVKKGDILCESIYSDNGEIVFGRNLLTAVMVYHGMNYEDGIVISDRLVKEGVFTSVHLKDLSFVLPPNKVLLSLSDREYKPLPDTYLQKVNSNEPYAIIKEIPVNSQEFGSVFEEPDILTPKRNVAITEVNIYANSWNESIPEFNDWIEKKIESQRENEIELQNILKEHVSDVINISEFIRDKKLDKFSHVGKYKNKTEEVPGIYIEMYGMYAREIQVGDKIANRHGNKGVISCIVPHEKMPKLDDGRHVDICINPLGIISRMNIGQLFELHLSNSFKDLKQQVFEMIDKKSTNKKIREYLIEYIRIVDKTKDNWYLKQFEQQLPKKITKEFVNSLSLIQAPFESCKLEDVLKALEYSKTRFRYNVFDSLSNLQIQNEIAAGYLYFFKMIHMAEDRLAARGVGTYTRRTLQPLGGRKNRGGQRCGEMENTCFVAHDAPINLNETLTVKSDCVDMKVNFIEKLLEFEEPKKDKEIDTTPESVKLFQSYLIVSGIDAE